MTANRLDSLSKTLGRRRSRRTTLKGAGAGLAAAALGAAGLRRGVTAQVATPPSEAEILADDTFLFVQTATGGTFAANPGAGTPEAGGGGSDYLLTLEGHPGGTVYFSDRPARIFGEAPTQAFLDGLGFSPENPPNAALVAQTADGDDVVVVELTNPVYDEATGTITYGANVLAEYAGEGLAHVAAQAADAEPPEAFGRASLFIDDCSDLVGCYNQWQGKPVGPLPGAPIGQCWSWSDFLCEPCGFFVRAHYDNLCNQTYPGACQDACVSSV